MHGILETKRFPEKKDSCVNTRDMPPALHNCPGCVRLGEGEEGYLGSDQVGMEEYPCVKGEVRKGKGELGVPLSWLGEGKEGYPCPGMVPQTWSEVPSPPLPSEQTNKLQIKPSVVLRTRAV